MEDPPLIHPDIRKAQTLPSRYYTESTVFDDLKSNVLTNLVLIKKKCDDDDDGDKISSLRVL